MKSLIETLIIARPSRRLHGRRGLKSNIVKKAISQIGRRLHGRRGLKSVGAVPPHQPVGSPPSRAAWIEICRKSISRTSRKSPPSRAAWIEIETVTALKAERERRRLHGRRGLKFIHGIGIILTFKSPPSRAAWIEINSPSSIALCVGSPPSRAAWIEIPTPPCSQG